MGHARALLGTPDRAFQEQLSRRVVAEDLSVREVEEAIRNRGRSADPEIGGRGRDRGPRRPVAGAGPARARGAPRRLPRDAGEDHDGRPARPSADRLRQPRGSRAHLPGHESGPEPGRRRSRSSQRSGGSSTPRRKPSTSARVTSGSCVVSIGRGRRPRRGRRARTRRRSCASRARSDRCARRVRRPGRVPVRSDSVKRVARQCPPSERKLRLEKYAQRTPGIAAVRQRHEGAGAEAVGFRGEHARVGAGYVEPDIAAEVAEGTGHVVGECAHTGLGHEEDAQPVEPLRGVPQGLAFAHAGDRTRGQAR